MSAGFFRGTTHEQDSRFSDKEKKLIKQKQWPLEFDIPVDLRKVDMSSIEPWINRKITKILGFEDEIVNKMTYNYLETSAKQDQKIDPRAMQLHLTGFLEKNTANFMLELWKLLIQAQTSENGIPQELIDEKNLEQQLKEEQLKQEKQKILDIQKQMLEIQQQQSQLHQSAQIHKIMENQAEIIQNNQSNPSFITQDKPSDLIISNKNHKKDQDKSLHERRSKSRSTSKKSKSNDSNSSFEQQKNNKNKIQHDKLKEYLKKKEYKEGYISSSSSENSDREKANKEKQNQLKTKHKSDSNSSN